MKKKRKGKDKRAAVKQKKKDVSIHVADDDASYSDGECEVYNPKVEKVVSQGRVTPC